MKQLGIIIVLLLLAGGLYLLLMNDNDGNGGADPRTDVDNGAATSTEEDNSDTSDEDDTDTDNDTETEEEEAISYCNELKSNVEGSADWNIMTNITDGATIASADEFTGCVYNVNDSYGGWAPFEGQIGYYEILADDGTSLATGPLQTVGDWMQLGLNNDPIKYQTALDFDASGYSNGTLVLHNENAAGLPEMDQTVEIDVAFETSN